MKDSMLKVMAFSIAVAVLSQASALRAETQTFPSSDVPKVINDNTTVTSTTTVSGISPYITNVAVTLDELTHTCDNQLEVFLIAPSGARTKLFGGVGDTGDDFTATVLDDHALTHITSGAAPFTGSFQPAGILGELQGENPNGTWRLEITDTGSGDTGTIENWSLTISAGDALGWLASKISGYRSNNLSPRIHGSYAVWETEDSNDWEIMCHHTESNVTINITTNNYDDRYPQINGHYVVWEGCNGVDSEIFLHDLTTWTTTQITNNGYDDAYPQVDGSTIAWCGRDDGDFDIFLYDTTTATTTKVTNNTYDDLSPEVSGRYVVWEGISGSDCEIFLYDGRSATTTQITNNSFDDYRPHIDGSTVVWSGFDGTDPEIFMYDIGTGQTTKITNNGYPDWYPLIDGSTIVWCGSDGGDDEIFLYDINTAVITRITENSADDSYPHLRGSNVVWHRYENGNNEIFFHNIATATTTRLTDNSVDDMYAVVCGSNVIWETHDGSKIEMSCMERTVCMSKMPADLDGNCQVDLADFAQWALQWLTCDLEPSDACWK